MQDKSESRHYSVESLLKAQLLMVRAWLRLLNVFTPESHGIADAARTLGFTTEWLFRRVCRLGRASLLTVQDCRLRKGRAMRMYRTVSPAFSVPFSLVPPETVGRHSRAQHLDLFETAIRRAFLCAPFGVLPRRCDAPTT